MHRWCVTVLGSSADTQCRLVHRLPTPREIVSVVKQMWGMIFSRGRSVHVFRRSPDVQRLTRMNCDGNVQIHHICRRTRV
jgi:hypothetical protein